MPLKDEQENGFGIAIFHDPATTNTIPQRKIVDIVAVHGLAGGRVSTWTDLKTGNMWLRDFLPSNIPEARIMSFGYQANPRSREQLGILSVAQALLQNLKAHRLGLQDRRIIFIGHSLGGLVIKKAILLAKEQGDPLLDAVFGIMFMGVPHRGAAIATLGSVLAQIISSATPTSTVLLKELQPRSATLQELSNSWQNVPTRFLFVSVYESAKTPISPFRGSTWVVPKDSAILLAGPREKQFPIIGADHRQICRFSSATDDQYINVWTSLRELVDQANGGQVPTRYLVDNKTVLNFTARGAEIAILQGLFGDQATKRYIIGIHGLPGVGKTQTAVKYAEESKNTYDSIFSILATTPHDLEAGFGQLAALLDLPARYQDDNKVKLMAVMEWFRDAKSWLLILDNVQEKDRDLINRSYLPGDSHGHILITTRSKIIAEKLTNDSVVLQPFPNSAAVDLLLREADLDVNDHHLRRLAGKIADSLDGLPLVLSIAGSTVMGKEKRFEKLAEDLSDPIKKQEFYRKRKYPFDGTNPTLEYLCLLRFEGIEGSDDSDDPGQKEPGELWKVFAFLNPSSISFSFFAATPKPTSPPLPDRYQEYEIDGILDEIAAQGFLTPKASDYYSIHDEIHAWIQMFVIKSDEEHHDARRVSQYATTWIVAGFRIYRFFDTWQEGNIYVRHAEECFKFMQRLSIESVDVGRMLTSASAYARFTGRYPQSEELSRQAIEVFKRQEDVSNEDIFQAKDTLALALRRQSKWDEAIILLETNLKEQEGLYGKLDKLTLGTLNELGWLYHLKGDYHVAYDYLERARDGREKVFGPDHGPTQHTWQNLAACLTQLGDYPRATDLYERALKGHTAMLGEDHFWVLHISGNLAQLLLKQGSAKRAEELFSKVLKLREKILPDNHPDIVRAKMGLADAYRIGSDELKAAELAREAVQGFERLMGPDDKETLEARTLLERLCIK